MANRCAVHGLTWLLFLITGCRSQCGFRKPAFIRLSGTSQTQVITSPRYPDNYPDNANCAWLVTAGHGYAIHLHVDWMELELATDCIYDNVSLYDGQSIAYPLLRSLCGERSGLDYYSSGSHMYVSFRSDFSDNMEGFRLEVKAIPAWAVPSPTPDPWLTTPRPSTSTSTTTTEASSSATTWQSHINTATLIGGLTGGLLLLFVCCALCRYYYSRSHPPHAHRLPCPSLAPLPPNTTSSSSSTVFQNHNAVFMVSPPGAGSGGHTNYAFAPYGEAPPAYFSVQQHAQTYTHMGSGGAPRGTATGADGSVYPLPPPSYNETMMLTHPPSSGGPAAAHHPYPYPLPPPPPFSVAVSSPSAIPPAPRRPAPPPPPARAFSDSGYVTSGSGYLPSGSGYPPSGSGYPPSSSGPAVPPSHEAPTPAGISIMASPPNYSVAPPPNQSVPPTNQSVVSPAVGSFPLPRSLSLPANGQSSVPTSWPVPVSNNTASIPTPDGHFPATSMSVPPATNEIAAASLTSEPTVPSGGFASPGENSPPE